MEKKMSLKSSILIIIFISNALGSQFFNTTKWNEIKKHLTKYEDSLLNDTIVTDLKKCYNYDNTTEENYGIGVACSIYFDLVLQINKTEPNKKITPEIIKYELGKHVDNNINITIFCDRVTHCIPDNNLFTDIDICKIGCLAIKTTQKTLKPICKIMDFMSILLTNYTTKVINTTTVETNKTDIPSLTSNISQHTVINKQNGDGILLVSNNENSSKYVDNELKIKPKLKLDTLEKSTSAVQLTKTDDINKTNSKQPMNAVPKSLSTQQAAPSVETPIKVEIKDNSSPININNNHEKVNQVNEDTNLDINNGGNIDDNDLDEDKLTNYYAQNDEGDINVKGSIPPIPADTKQNNLNNDVKLDQSPESTFDKSSVGDIKNQLDKNDHNKIILNDPFYEKTGSNFFTYLLIAMFSCILLYVAYHNKSKILALLLEGRRGQKGRIGRRKHTAAYRKLDSNLEEAITSPSSARTSQIIY